MSNVTWPSGFYQSAFVGYISHKLSLAPCHVAGMLMALIDNAFDHIDGDGVMNHADRHYCDLLLNCPGLGDALVAQGFISETGSGLKFNNLFAFQHSSMVRVKPHRRKVYFIQNESSGLVKIGSAAAPHKRLDYLQTAAGGKLVLLAQIDGGTSKEKSLHKQFGALREHGEWFRYEQPLRDFIAEVADGR